MWHSMHIINYYYHAGLYKSNKSANLVFLERHGQKSTGKEELHVKI